MAGLHVLTHDEDHIGDCEVCELVSATNLTPLVGVEANDYAPVTLGFLALKAAMGYDFVHDVAPKTGALFSRPPPYFL